MPFVEFDLTIKRILQVCYLSVPLMFFVLIQLMWIAFLTQGHNEAGSPTFLKASLAIIAIAGVSFHFMGKRSLPSPEEVD